MRLWFLRGIADSDGDVDFRDRSVNITSQPNTEFFSKVLASVGVRNSTSHERKRNVGRVTISVPDAMKIRVFNPGVLAHRRGALERLAKAKTYQRHWPEWLKEKVEGLIREGKGVRMICETVLEEDNTFIKMHTVKRKMMALKELGSGGEPRAGLDPATPASL